MAVKILLVDDVKMFLELEKGFLKLSSAHILTAGDGLEAFEIVRKEAPAIVIMDLHMPRMDGAECCARLKADPLLRKVPVIMVTAAGKAEDRELCEKAGCDGFLTKPLDRVLFLEKARTYLPSIDRRNLRVPCRTKVKFRAFGVTLSGEISDVSENGVYMATSYEVREGTILELLFTLPNAAGTVIQSRGRVAWLNTGEKRLKRSIPEGFGVEFVQISDAMKGAVNRFIEGKS